MRTTDGSRYGNFVSYRSGHGFDTPCSFRRFCRCRTGLYFCRLVWQLALGEKSSISNPASCRDRSRRDSVMGRRPLPVDQNRDGAASTCWRYDLFGRVHRPLARKHSVLPRTGMGFCCLLYDVWCAGRRELVLGSAGSTLAIWLNFIDPGDVGLTFRTD